MIHFRAKKFQHTHRFLWKISRRNRPYRVWQKAGTACQCTGNDIYWAMAYLKNATKNLNQMLCINYAWLVKTWSQLALCDGFQQIEWDVVPELAFKWLLSFTTISNWFAKVKTLVINISTRSGMHHTRNMAHSQYKPSWWRYKATKIKTKQIYISYREWINCKKNIWHRQAWNLLLYPLISTV